VSKENIYLKVRDPVYKKPLTEIFARHYKSLIAEIEGMQRMAACADSAPVSSGPESVLLRLPAELKPFALERATPGKKQGSF